MIPDRKINDPQIGNDPQIEPQMIPNRYHLRSGIISGTVQYQNH